MSAISNPPPAVAQPTTAIEFPPPAVAQPTTAIELLDSAEITLKPIDNPLEKKTSTSFEVNFGSETKQLKYSLRHNSVSAKVNPSDLARLSGQTRLLLQQTNKFYTDQISTETGKEDQAKQEKKSVLSRVKGAIRKATPNRTLETACFRSEVLQDITGYNIRFNPDGQSVTLEIHDSKGRFFKHTLEGNISGNATTSTFDVQTYLDKSKNFVKQALENDRDFANKSGYTFFVNYVESGGVIPQKNTGRNQLSSTHPTSQQNIIAQMQRQERLSRQRTN